jgi:fucose 4-O-acetylase-like acetyltransferase
VERNRYADLLRVLAISLVIIGHWLLTDITYRPGQLSGLDAMHYVSWSGWATLFFQVMPVFFVVGGYVNATSWTAHHALGEGWTGWVRERVMRLLWPTTVYVTFVVAAADVSEASGVRPATLAQAGWLVSLQLWFLPVYLVLIALTPVMLAAHRRWELAVPAVMALAAAGVDAGVLGPHLHLIGFANYFLVWGSMHQWGFAWRDGTLTHPRWRPYALAAGGAAVLAGLLAWSPFPVDMIGFGGVVGNTTPPSIALLAFAAAQTGLVLAAAPAISRALARPRLWRPVKRLNAMVMTTYLWHMVPVIVVAVTLYPDGLLPQPAVGSAQWWELRPLWLALLAAVLVPVIAGVTWLARPLRRLPMGLGPTGWWSPVALLLGIAFAIPALARLAIDGFAPNGRLPILILGAYFCALALTLLSGRPQPVDTHDPLRAPGN